MTTATILACIIALSIAVSLGVVIKAATRKPGELGSRDKESGT